MSDERLIWIDGAPGTALPLPDRGLDFGDGLFETLLVRKGVPLWPEYHFQRLKKGAAVLGLPDCLQRVQAEIGSACEAIAGRGWDWSALRLTLTRGEGPRGYAPPLQATPRIIITASVVQRDCAQQMPAARLCLADITVAQQPALAGIKHLNRLEQVLASGQASASGFDEALLRDDRGRVISVSAGNVFAVFGKELVTPVLNNCGIAGTRRRLTLERWASDLSERLFEARSAPN